MKVSGTAPTHALVGMHRRSKLLVLGVLALAGAWSAARWLHPPRAGTVVQRITRPGGDLVGAHFGYSVCLLDRNGDRRPDIAVSAPGERAVYILSGPEFVASVRLAPNGAASGEPEDDRPGGGSRSGDRPATDFGFCLAGADLDGDGRDELLVGDPSASRAEIPDEGAVWVLWSDPGRPPLELRAAEGCGPARVGTSLAVADFDGDGFQDVACGAPGRTGGKGTGWVDVHCGPFTEDGARAIVRLDNHQREGFANFGHDLAVCDWNGDGAMDLAVSAIWNTHSRGIRGRGQVIVQLGPIRASGPARRVILEDDDPETETEDLEVRWGMSIAGHGRSVLVGAPRKPASGIHDAGVGFLFAEGLDAWHLRGDPVSDGILGYRVKLADLDGDGRVDPVLASLLYGIVAWSATDSGAPADRRRVVDRPDRGSSHWCRGLAIGDVRPGRGQEFVLGDDLYPFEARGGAAERRNYCEGRVLVVRGSRSAHP